MANAFISYRRKPSAALAQLVQEKLKNHHDIDAYVDTTRTDSTRVMFPERLMQAIADAPVFICLLGEGTLDSEWVHKEIERAYELQKRCIPVFQESYTPPATTDSAVEYLLRFDGVHVFDVKAVFVDESVAQIAALCVSAAPPLRSGVSLRGMMISAGVLALIAVLALIVLPVLNPPALMPTAATRNLTHTENARAVVDSGTANVTPSLESVPAATNTSTLDIAQVVASLDAQATLDQATANVLGTAAARATAVAATTQPVIDATATAARWTPTPSSSNTLTPNMTASIDTYRTQRAATETQQFFRDQTVTATRWTNTPTPTYTPTPEPLQAALDAASMFRGSNADWQALYPDGFQHTFDDGVVMVLVPAGSYMIGANPQGDDERNGSVITFDAPFWIDLTEVTQADFERLGGIAARVTYFSGDQRPVEQITWFEAHDFCALRGARLPTEAEWEYAARGPDEWIYPWGDTWNASKAVWTRSSSQGTAGVGSIPAGRSWVGAFDLSGNVWEWVSSLYLPYNTREDREADTGDRTDVRRAVRGGSWLSLDWEFLRAGYRNGFNPSDLDVNLGFRCTRSN
jgi:formylglycine-generating enzyme required for sulfatase activity